MTEEDAELSLSEVHRYLKREGIATYKMPDQVEQVEVWPLTSVGKIDKKVLVQMAQGKKDERENVQ